MSSMRSHPTRIKEARVKPREDRIPPHKTASGLVCPRNRVTFGYVSFVRPSRSNCVTLTGGDAWKRRQSPSKKTPHKKKRKTPWQAAGFHRHELPRVRPVDICGPAKRIRAQPNGECAKLPGFPEPDEFGTFDALCRRCLLEFAAAGRTSPRCASASPEAAHRGPPENANRRAETGGGRAHQRAALAGELKTTIPRTRAFKASGMSATPASDRHAGPFPRAPRRSPSWKICSSGCSRCGAGSGNERRKGTS